MTDQTKKDLGIEKFSIDEDEGTVKITDPDLLKKLKDALDSEKGPIPDVAAIRVDI